MESIIENLLTHSMHSSSFDRQLNFLSVLIINQKFNFLTINSRESNFLIHAEKNSTNSVLMLGLTDLISEKFKLVLSNRKIDILKEFEDCLASAEFDRKNTAKFIICYLTNLILIYNDTQQRDDKSKEDQMKLLKSIYMRKVLDYFIQNDEFSTNITNLVSSNISIIGYINLEASSVHENYRNMREIFIIENLNHIYSTSKQIIYPCYYFILSNIFFKLILNPKNSKMQMLGKSVIDLVFNSPESIPFLHEYENLSKLFDSTNNLNDFDIFLEYTKPFKANGKTKRIIENDNESLKAFKQVVHKIKDLTLRKPSYFFQFSDKEIIYDSWITGCII